MAIYTGRITRITTEEIWVEVGALGFNQEFPCRWVGIDIEEDDQVLVVGVDGAMEDLVVVGKLNGTID